MRKPRVTLSEMASKVLAFRRADSECELDLAAFHAPSECYNDSHRASIKSLVKMFRRAGWTPKAYNNSMVCRLGEKVSFKLNLLVDDRPDWALASLKRRRW